MKNKGYEGYLFITPILLLFCIFVIYPIVYNINVSFYEWNGISIDRTFVGTQNYISLMEDPVLMRILRNFALFSIFTILTQAFIGIILAQFLIRHIPLSNLYRTLFYLPAVATPTIIGNIYARILEANFGNLNVFLRSVGLDALAQPWLADPRLALWVIIYINIWRWTGYSMLLYYANMLNIPEDLYESATIDGAGRFQQFTRITFPLLRNTHFTLFVLGAIGALSTFDLPFILTDGGPNHATEFFSTYIFRHSFRLFQQGMSSTIVIFMLVIALVITAAQMKLYFYKDKDKELAG